VLEAIRYLVQTSELFKKEGIKVQENWINIICSENTDEWHEFLRDPKANTDCSSDESQETLSETQEILSKNSHSDVNVTGDSLESATTCSTDSVDDNDDWCEVEERFSGSLDTLLQPQEMIDGVDKIISFAPGEGNRPLGIFMDTESEYLSFPAIFCGKQRASSKEREVPVSYSTICKWELRSKDRRVAESVPNIFYKLKKLQIKQIQDTARISLRKCKTKGKIYTAGELKSDDYLSKLINLDEGYRVLRNLRGSPPYFEKSKKDLFAMIHQPGNPTWFCSFSAAETRWSHLLRILGRVVHQKDYSDYEIANMSWQEKSDLIQKDPVTCARNFEHMVQLLIKDVLKSTAMPFGEIADYVYRVEFQQRGSPHIHALFWVKGAPTYGKAPDDTVLHFVDKYVTCKNSQSDEMKDLVNLQLHRHAKTCKKLGHNFC